MKCIQYDQHWLMEDWVQDLDHVADQVFFNQPEVAWIRSQGYEGLFTKQADHQMECMIYTIKFWISEADYLMLLLRWPENLNIKLEL